MITLSDWVPRGYPRLANLMEHDRDATIFRRFGSLTMLNLLSLQAELIELENDYAEACKEDDVSGNEDYESLSSNFFKLRHPDLKDNRQKHIIDKIRRKLREYHKSLLVAAQIDSLPAPEKRDFVFLDKWLIGKKEGQNFLRGMERFTWKPVDKNRLDIFRKKECLTLAKKSERLLQPWLINTYHWVWGGRSEHRKVISDEELGRTLDYSSEGSSVVSIATKMCDLCGVVMASILPMIAVVILYLVKNTLKRIGLSIAFSAIFGMALQILTSATIKEVFAATTAFAAIEVVFIGSVND